MWPRAIPSALSLPGFEVARADLRDAPSVRAALDGADAAVNAVSPCVETRDVTFEATHVEAAARLAEAASEARLTRLVHISGIGSDAGSASPYVRARGRGEEAVRAGFPGATSARPSAMFGPDDAFLTTLLGLVRRLPVVPLFGGGSTRLQPVHVENVASSTSSCVRSGAAARCYPYHFRSGMRSPRRVGCSPALTEGQVALMRRDDVAGVSSAGLGADRITRRSAGGFRGRCRPRSRGGFRGGAA